MVSLDTMQHQNSMSEPLDRVLFPTIDELPRAVHLGTIKRKVLRIKQQQLAAKSNQNKKEADKAEDSQGKMTP